MTMNWVDVQKWEETERRLAAKTGYESLEAFAVEVGVDVSRGYTEDVLRTLSQAGDVIHCGKERTAALAAVEFWTAALKLAIRDAGGAGIPKAWMARAAGVTRQTVYDTLRG